MTRSLRLAVAALLLCVAPELRAQAAPPAPQPADVASMDAIIDALYASISGPAGAERQWERFKSLFTPGARLIPTGRRPDSTWTANVLSPEDYIARSDAALKANGFFEREIARKTDRYGNIVQIFSTYESRRAASDERPFARGINSIQLRYDGKRWWIVTVFWEGESPLHPIPAEYLPKK